MSQSLTKGDSQYPIHKLEFLALKWSITTAFHDYLYGNTATVKSYNNLLTYVLTSAQLDVTGHLSVASFASCNFNVKYKVRKTNIDADTLSHIDWGNSISAESMPTSLNIAIEGMSPLVDICGHSTWEYLSLT